MNFGELYKILSECYPDELRCEWDNDGIMCASDLSRKVNKVLISLDITDDTINYAVEKGFDTIISHHPLIFRSQNRINPLNYVQSKIIKLIQNNVSVISFHTRLDSANTGVNDILCRILDIRDISIDPCDRIGRIGYIDEITLFDFAAKVKKALSSPFVLYSGNKNVHKVYVVGGDGKDMIENAMLSGCDTIITGRASYNASVDACDMGINIVEAGHFFTEHPVCFELQKKVEEVLPNVVTEVYYSNKICFI